MNAEQPYCLSRSSTILLANGAHATEVLAPMRDLFGFFYSRQRVSSLGWPPGTVVGRRAHLPRPRAFSVPAGAVCRALSLDWVKLQVRALAVRCTLPHPGVPVWQEKPVGSDVRPPVAQEFRRVDVFALDASASVVPVSGATIEDRYRSRALIQVTGYHQFGAVLWGVVSENSRLPECSPGKTPTHSSSRRNHDHPEPATSPAVLPPRCRRSCSPSPHRGGPGDRPAGHPR